MLQRLLLLLLDRFLLFILSNFAIFLSQPLLKAGFDAAVGVLCIFRCAAEGSGCILRFVGFDKPAFVFGVFNFVDTIVVSPI